MGIFWEYFAPNLMSIYIDHECREAFVGPIVNLETINSEHFVYFGVGESLIPSAKKWKSNLTGAKNAQGDSTFCIFWCW